MVLTKVLVVLYIVRKKKRFFWWNKDYKNLKLIKRYHAYKVYASIYNVKLLNSFYPELQLEYTAFTFRNKLEDLLSELRGFKFVATLVLEFRKIGSDERKLKQLLMRMILTMYLNQSILRLYQASKNLLGLIWRFDYYSKY